MPRRKSDFSQKTVEELGRRSALLCSNPDCRKPTVGPKDQPTGSINVGVAAHIRGASPGPGGARYDPTMSDEARRDASNGVWLCVQCSIVVDRDEAAFPIELLNAWKTMSEHEARMAIVKPRPRPVDMTPILNKLGRYLHKFEDLERDCIASQGSEEIVRRSLDLYNDVWIYLKDNVDLGAAGQFKAARSWSAQGPNGYPFDKMDVLLLITGRKACLIQLVSDLRPRR